MMADTKGRPVYARRGIVCALASALLFGASMPCAKMLVGAISPTMLAGLLYLGSGIGLGLWWLVRRRWTKPSDMVDSVTERSTGLHNIIESPTFEKAGHPAKTAPEAGLTRRDLPWLAGAVVTGGVIGPVLLMWGLARTPASTSSLLLNLEGVFTALIAWFAFRENVDRRIAWGMFVIVAGGGLLSWSGRPELGVPWGILAVAAACLAWGIDNNLTRKVSASDPVQITAIKGLVAGAVNVTIAVCLGVTLPDVFKLLMAGLLGVFGFGVSLVLFIVGLRLLGAARTSAYFSTAPFAGAALSVVVLHEPITVLFLAAAALMAWGLWLHATEIHDHVHHHPSLTHEHRHEHDAHHQHSHPLGIDPRGPHSHVHEHRPIRHAHPHYPDIHHRHGH